MSPNRWRRSAVRPSVRHVARRARTRWLPAAAMIAVASVSAGEEPGVHTDDQHLASGPPPDRAEPSTSSTTGYDSATGRLGLPYGPGGGELALGDGALASPGTRAAEGLREGDIPDVAMEAYLRAEAALGASDPSCGLDWSLLAAIGRVESDHGRHAGSTLGEDGDTSRPIRGLPLDGRGDVARITDTDDGALDGDRTYDRAVGPMQFIPSTWERVAVDGNVDGERDPDNVFDAALGAGVYLCAGDTDLGDPDDLARAVLRYNPSHTYVATVLALAEAYARDPADPLPEPGVPPERVPSLEQPPPPPASPGPSPDPDRRDRDGHRDRDDGAAPPPSSVRPPSGDPGSGPSPSDPPSTASTTTTTARSTTTTTTTAPSTTTTTAPSTTTTTAPSTTTTTAPSTTTTTAPSTTTTTAPSTTTTTTPSTTTTTTAPSTTTTTAPPDEGTRRVTGDLPSGPFALHATGGDGLLRLRLVLPSGTGAAVENAPDVLAREWRVDVVEGRLLVWGYAPADVRTMVVTVAGSAAGETTTVTVPTVPADVAGAGGGVFATALPEGATIQAMEAQDAAGAPVLRGRDVAGALAPVADLTPGTSAYLPVDEP